MVGDEADHASGLGDYAERLAAALVARGHEDAGDGLADVAVFNHAPYARGVALGWLRAVRRGRALRRGSSLVVVHHEVFERPDDRLRMRLFEAVQRWSFVQLERMSSATVVADEERAARLSRLLPRARAPLLLSVGPNVVVPDSAPGRAPEPVIAAFGLMHPNRDLETLVDAVAVLAQRVPQVRLVVVGDLSGDQRRADALRARAAAGGSPLELTGFLPPDAVAAELAAARVFVSTYVDAVSLGSGALAAAFGWGLPVVVYAGARLHPQLVAGDVVVEAERDPAALAAVLEHALGAGGDEPAAAGRALYERELAWPAIVERLEPLLAAAAAMPTKA